MVVACSGAACSEVDDSASNGDELAVSGRWVLPPEILEAGAKARLRYDGAPRWSANACSGRLMMGTNELGRYLRDAFDAVGSVGGYACRKNTANASKMSVHGTGRALDVFIPKIGGKANNTKGDAVANWLVENATSIGVQLVIWDRTVWLANGKNDRPYSGPHPHDDHIHVEITAEAAAMQTEWFTTVADRDGGASDGSTTDAATDAGDPDDLEPPTHDDPDAGPPSPRPPLDAGAPPKSPPSEPPPDHEAPDGGLDHGGGDGDDDGERSPSTDDEDEHDESPAGWEESDADDEPGERDSLGPSSAKKGASRSSSPDQAIESAGCRAATSSPGDGMLALAALAVAATSARRRRGGASGPR